MKKYIHWVYHLEDNSGPESGPRPPERVYDRSFTVEEVAKRWIRVSKNPKKYFIEKELVEDHILRQHCGNRECNRGPVYCECFEDL